MNDPARAVLAEAEAAYALVVAHAAGAEALTSRLVRDVRRSGDVEALVVALRAQAWAEHGRFALRSAMRRLDEAADLAQRHGLPSRRGEILVSRAAVNSELGRMEAAHADLAEAAELVTAQNRPELVLQEATLLANIGRAAEAVTLFRGLLSDPATPVAIRAKVANNLAHELARRGRYAEAATYAEQAERDADALGPALAAYFAQTRAWVTMLEGRLGESLALFGRAGSLYEAAELPLGEHYLEYAEALVQLRLIPEALAAARSAASEFTNQHALLMAADADLQVARLTLLTGDFALARTRATRAAARFRRQGRTAWVARAAVVAHEATSRNKPLTSAQLRALEGCAGTLEQLGMVTDAVEAHLVAGRLAAASARSDRARASLSAAGRLSRRSPFLVRLNGRVARALVAELDGDARTVVRTARAGLEDLDRHRAALPSMELRALASGHGAELGQLGLAALLPRGSGSRVFEWMERTRAAALVTVDHAPPAEVETELAALRALQAELAEGRRTAGHESRHLLIQITAAEERIRRATWSATTAHDASHRTISTSEVRRLLDGETLVEYGVLEDVVVAAVVDARRVRLIELGAASDVVHHTDALLFALRRLARPASKASSTAARLSSTAAVSRLHELLVRPLRIPADAPLIVVPVGHLQRIPWAPLHSAATTVVPSATFWARTRLARGTGSRSVALIAGPDLAGAVDEVDALAKVHPQADLLVPPDSTAGTVTSALHNVGLAHLACHGTVRADNPSFSSLLLSDGPLTVHELGLRNGAPHRIVLAACDSGVQVSYPGDEALGFVSALFARGTAGLVASSVLVPDLDALPLMQSLHEHVARGAPLAEALFTARVGLDLDEPGQYVNWCAFNTYGAG